MTLAQIATEATTMTRKYARDTAAPPKSHYKTLRSHCVIGFERIGTQEPYFHVLGGTQGRYRNNRWEDFGLCANHRDVRENWPEYAHLIRWHLAGVVSGPGHYEANALYHAQQVRAAVATSMDTSMAIEAFKRHVVWGAVEADGALGPPPWIWAEGNLRDWLRARLPALMATFKADLDKLFPRMFDAALAAHGK